VKKDSETARGVLGRVFGAPPLWWRLLARLAVVNGQDKATVSYVNVVSTQRAHPEDIYTALRGKQSYNCQGFSIVGTTRLPLVRRSRIPSSLIIHKHKEHGTPSSLRLQRGCRHRDGRWFSHGWYAPSLNSQVLGSRRVVHLNFGVYAVAKTYCTC
jgi:hypothetical protein